jgi:hypothetical protein
LHLRRPALGADKFAKREQSIDSAEIHFSKPTPRFSGNRRKTKGRGPKGTIREQQGNNKGTNLFRNTLRN